MAFELPFILYDNVLESGTVTASSEAAGFPKENVYDWLDWTMWKAGAGGNQTIDVDAGSAITVDTVALLGHNFVSGSYFQVFSDDNPSFSSPTSRFILTGSDSNDKPIYMNLSSHAAERYYRFFFSVQTGAAYISILWLGTKMTIPVGPEFSFDPDLQNIKSEKFVSYSGRMVSSAVQYSEREMRVSFRRIAKSFIDSDLLPFLEDHYGQMKPFFFVPDPGDEFGTDKIHYLVAPDDPTIELPVYNDQIDFRNWTLRAQGVRQSTFR